MTKQLEKLSELKSNVRLLAFITLIGFGITSITLISTCITTFNDPIINNKISGGSKLPKGYDPFGKMKKQLIIYTVLASLLTASCILLFIASFNRNMWFTLPYFVMTLALVIQYAYTLFVEGFCLGKEENYDFNSPCNKINGGFVMNVMVQGGGPIFTSIITLSLLLYAFIPVFGFFMETRSYRAEKLAEERRNAPPKPTPSTSSKQKTPTPTPKQSKQQVAPEPEPPRKSDPMTQQQKV